MGKKIHAEVKEVDHGWKRFWKTIAEMENSYVKVGVFGDTESGGMHEVDPVTGRASDLTVGEIAAVNEFGTQDGHVPERSFLRSTFDEKHPELVEMAHKAIDKVLEGHLDTRTALNMMGSKLATDVKNKITMGAGVPPPNAPATIAAKGSDRPLVDTGRLVNAVTWQVTIHGSEEEHEGGEGGDHGHE